MYGKEYFFGGSGVQWCSPGTTVMGQPLQVEDLGETQITEEVFADYLRTQSNDRFRGDRCMTIQNLNVCLSLLKSI